MIQAPHLFLCEFCDNRFVLTAFALTLHRCRPSSPSPAGASRTPHSLSVSGSGKPSLESSENLLEPMRWFPQPSLHQPLWPGEGCVWLRPRSEPTTGRGWGPVTRVTNASPPPDLKPNPSTTSGFITGRGRHKPPCCAMPLLATSRTLGTAHFPSLCEPSTVTVKPRGVELNLR